MLYISIILPFVTHGIAYNPRGQVVNVPYILGSVTNILHIGNKTNNFFF